MSTYSIEVPDEYAKCVDDKFGSVESLCKQVILDCVLETKREEAVAKAPAPDPVDDSQILVTKSK